MVDFPWLVYQQRASGPEPIQNRPKRNKTTPEKNLEFESSPHFLRENLHVFTP